jgi:hypothetical protein
MLPGDAPTGRDRSEPTKWSNTVVGGAPAWLEISMSSGLFCLCGPDYSVPSSTISSARDEPYRWEHLQEAFSTLRYQKIQCCTRHDLPLSPAIWVQKVKAKIAGD